MGPLLQKATFQNGRIQPDRMLPLSKDVEMLLLQNGTLMNHSVPHHSRVHIGRIVLSIPGNNVNLLISMTEAVCKDAKDKPGNDDERTRIGMMTPCGLDVCTVHRHENSVIDSPLKIHNDTSRFIILNKPSSIPAYPESGENGSKSAKTLFHPYTSMSSNIVECLPETGRMHQIRVHLQSTGLLVIGDNLYSNKHMWGDKNGLNGDYCGRTDDDIIAKFNELHSYEKYVLKENSASKSSLGDDRLTVIASCAHIHSLSQKKAKWKLSFTRCHILLMTLRQIRQLYLRAPY
ncbi:hypothetical protein GJ496_001843 [Pomphorhynchus laevis]|nr:hypothetical protein GJ496_001843 [Pomphorhynchus laevis]